MSPTRLTSGTRRRRTHHDGRRRPGSLFIVVAVLFIGSMSGCASKPDIAPLSSPGPGPMTVLERRIWDNVRDWQGAPYLWGGVTANGIDCSAFVQTIYRRTFGIDLPRTTAEQVHVGVPVAWDRVDAGDLVFFLSPDRSRHVGIYLRNRMFVHATKSGGGVKVSRLDDAHWRSIFWTARRILSPEQVVRISN